MIDGYGRVIDYVRMSVTDRCSLRCVYCMPESGVQPVDHDSILRYDEIVRLAGIFSSLGIRKIKLTGGEPLVRKNVSSLVADLKKIPGIQQVTMTTNGVSLAEQMAELAGAGIDGINLSLDTLHPEVFEQITGRPFFDRVMEGFHTALQYPSVVLKINCVIAGIAGQDVTGIAELAKQYPVHVRYIEMMPIGLGKQFRFCGGDRILQELSERYGSYRICREKLGNGPGRYVSFDGFTGKVGFISAVTHKFCDSCNRIRLTAQGFLKTCLQYDTGVDLRALLRNGATDEIIQDAVRKAVTEKPSCHHFERSGCDTACVPGETAAAGSGGRFYADAGNGLNLEWKQEERWMSQIGG